MSASRNVIFRQNTREVFDMEVENALEKMLGEKGLYFCEGFFYNESCLMKQQPYEEREPACVALHREGCGVESILEAAGVWISPGSICP